MAARLVARGDLFNKLKAFIIITKYPSVQKHNVFVLELNIGYKHIYIQMMEK